MNPTDLFETLQNWTNQLSQSWLSLDPLLQQRINNCADQTVEVECTQPSLIVHINIFTDRLTLHRGPAAAPNVQLRGTATALLSRALTDESLATVEVNGDETLLLELLDILRGYRPDLAPVLAKLLGDDTAQTITAALELAAQTARRLASSQIQDVVQTSKTSMQRHFAAQVEADELQSQLDQLRLRIDRAAARVQNLEQSSQRRSKQ
jgi:ubiquinone biosynthesis protein UbiJ